MGTTYTIKYIKREETPSYKIVKNHIDAFLKDYNQSVSTYIPNSTISKFNKGKANIPIQVDEYFLNSLKLSRKIHKMSEGFFDPSIGPLVNLWGFGPKKTSRQPSKREIDKTLEFTGLNKLKAIEPSKMSIEKFHENFQLDFSAVAKGEAVDYIANDLEHKFFIRDFMIEIGGEVRVKSFKKESWSIGIETPKENNRAILKILPIKEGALATSGNYRNFFEKDGRKFGHTINPFNGESVQTSILSSSVVSTTCGEADAWATAFMAMGLENAIRIADKFNISALFVVNHQGELVQRTSKSWTY